MTPKMMAVIAKQVIKYQFEVEVCLDWITWFFGHSIRWYPSEIFYSFYWWNLLC